jgi:hypothetical protein
VPAAKAVTKVAAKIEAQSGVLASKIAGKSVKAKVATAKRAVTKKVVAAKKVVVAKKAVRAPKAA